MLCGTPVVASDLPGVREPTARSGMGRAVPPGDPEALAQALIEVLGAPGLYSGSAEAIARYSSESVAIEYERLFERLLGGAPPSNA
jgi:glycosyltransferase involved in cell wall biosynthesis